MSKLNFISGPYRLLDIDALQFYNHEPGDSLPIVSEGDNMEGYVICDVYNAGPECLDEDLKAQAIATGKLFAASHDLLQALKIVLRHGLLENDEYGTVLNTIHSAIKKAED